MKKLILLYNFDEKRAAKVRRSALPLKMGVTIVEKQRYNQPIGVLVGLKDIQAVNDDFSGNGFDEEMLVMYGFMSRDIDLLIRAMNKNGVGKVPLKAVVTSTNILWNSTELYNAVKKDHEEMSGKN